MLRTIAACVLWCVLLQGCAKAIVSLSARPATFPISFSEGFYDKGRLVSRDNYEVVHHFSIERGHWTVNSLGSDPERIDLTQDFTALVQEHKGAAIVNLKVQAGTYSVGVKILTWIPRLVTLGLIAPGYAGATIEGDVIRILERARPSMSMSPQSHESAATSAPAPVSPEAQLIASGKSIYEGKGTCHACHGKGGKGDGPAGQKLTPKPIDLTNPQALRFKTDAERLHVLKNGIPGTSMVALVPIVISEEEAAAVIAYLHTLLSEH